MQSKIDTNGGDDADHFTAKHVEQVNEEEAKSESSSSSSSHRSTDESSSRGAPGSAPSGGSATPAEADQLDDATSDRILKALAAIQKNMKEMVTKSDMKEVVTKLDRLVVQPPSAGLPTDGFVVGSVNELMVRDAVIRGGSAVWSIVQEQEDYFAVSALHCAVREKGEKDKIKVRVPKRLVDLVTQVGFRVVDGKVDPTPGADICALKLKTPPAGLNAIPWHKDVSLAEKVRLVNVRPNTVAGYGVHTIVKGRDAVNVMKPTSTNVEELDHFVFIGENFESGLSGTIMWVFNNETLSPSTANNQSNGSYGVPIGVFKGTAGAGTKSSEKMLMEWCYVCPLPQSLSQDMEWFDAEHTTEGLGGTGASQDAVFISKGTVKFGVGRDGRETDTTGWQNRFLVTEASLSAVFIAAGIQYLWNKQ